MALGCFVSTGRSLPAALERVRLAEELGYESCWVTHVNGRESLTVLTAYAGVTQRIRLGTGVVPDLHAHAGHDGADRGDDRGRLRRPPEPRPRRVAPAGRRGLARPDDRQARRRDARVRRRSCARSCAASRRRPANAGAPASRSAAWARSRTCRSTSRRSRPAMLRLAGEVADGVVLWLCNPRYIADVVVPALREGRARAGKDLEGFDVVAAVPAAVVDDPATAWAAMRRDLVPYLGLPFYRAMLERSGFGADLEAYDAAAARGDVDGLQAAASDELLGALTAVGDADAVRAGIRRYLDAGATSPCWARSPGRTSRPRCGPGRRGGAPTDRARRGGPRRRVGWARAARPARRRPRPVHLGRARLRHRPLQLPLPVLHARRRPALAPARRGPDLRGDRARRRRPGLDGRRHRPADRRRAARPPRVPAPGRHARRRPRRARAVGHDQRLPARARRARRSWRRASRASTSRSTRFSATASSR